MRFQLRSGLNLHYRTRGAGRVVAFLHPIGIHGAFWDPIADLLAERYRVLAIDFRGHGGSDVPQKPFGLDDLAADIVEMLGILGGDQPVIVGCSLGGMVAQGIALQAPNLAGGLVLADTNHELSAEGRNAMAQRAKDAAQGMPHIIESTITRWFGKDFQAAHKDVVERVRGWLLEADPIVHSWSWSAIRELNYGAGIAAIKAPTLVVCGSEDVSCPPAAAKRIAATIPRARYEELAGGCHMAPLEQPSRFAQLVDEFIAKDVGP
jgi:3-oxoadipate enol-lactonase